MLSAIGDLLARLVVRADPPTVRLEGSLDLPDGVSELEIVDDLRSLAGRDRHLDDLVCFAGAGAYDHFIPAVVWALASRSEFSTAYTPYQPELSQGVLQVLFEFQSMVCELTGLEVSNASLYDGATALVEAVNMARSGRRTRVLVSEGVDPRLVETLRTYGKGPGTSPRSSLPRAAGGIAGRGRRRGGGRGPASQRARDPRAGVGARSPRRGRRVRRRSRSSTPCRSVCWRLPASSAPTSPSPRGSPSGTISPSAGPYLGLIAARMADVRRMPGRIVGETVDVDGAPGYVLTLQAREQHIRREKANSNICTNQTLMAVAATIYLGWLGPEGLAEIGRLMRREGLLRRGAADRDPTGVSLLHPDAPFFKEFALRVPGRADRGRRGARGARVPGRCAVPRGGGRRAARRRHGAADAGADRRARGRAWRR